MDCAPDSDEYFGVEEYESHQGKEHCENESSPVGVKSANNKFDLFKLIKVDVRSTKQDLNVLRRRIQLVLDLQKIIMFSQVLKVQQGGGITHSEGCQN